MRGNTVTLHLKKSSVATAGRLFQYDYGQRLILADVVLPDAYEVHFANNKLGESKTMIGNATGVDVPDEMLLSGDNVHVWLYLHDGETDGETEYEGVIYVTKRAKPTDQEPTPVQQSTVDQAIAALNQAVEKTTEAKEAAEEAQEAAEEAQHATETALVSKADKRDTVLETTLSRGRKAGTTVGTGSFAFGGDVEASGNYAHAEGGNTHATSASSHAEGNSTTASGNSSHAEGVATAASGEASHAEGKWNIASGDYSHAEGGGSSSNRATTASGTASHAEGVGAIASGGGAHAEGTYTSASATGSHAEGLQTKAESRSQHAQGKWNVSDANDAYADIVGNGTADNARSNAFALTWTGDGHYAGDVYVHANPDSSGGDKLATENYVDDAISQINTMSIHICTAQEYDSQTGIPTIANPDASTFYLVPGGEGNNLFIEWVYVNNTWEKFGAANVEVPVQDVQVNGTSILDQNGVANVPIATGNTLGLVKKMQASSNCIDIQQDGSIGVYAATASIIKTGTNNIQPIAPSRQHDAVFYGLAKAAGDTTQSQSANPVGQYTEAAIAAIQTMLGVPSTSDIPEYATDAETQSIITDWEVSA